MRNYRVLVAADGNARVMVNDKLHDLQFQVVDAPSLHDARSMLEQQPMGFDAAIITTILPDGLGACLVEALRRHPRPCCSVLLDNVGYPGLVLDAIARGATFVLSGSLQEGLARCVEQALDATLTWRGLLAEGPALAGSTLLNHGAEPTSGPFSSSEDFFSWVGQQLIRTGKLTTAEAAVVRLLVLGRSYSEVALVRGVCVDTVKYQVKSILRKLHADTCRDFLRIVGCSLDPETHE